MELIECCNVCGGNLIRPADSDWNLYQCLDCEYVFDNPRPTLEEISAFYSKPTKYDSWIDELQARDALWQRRLKKLLPYSNKGSLLDVGTGIGQFLHHAQPFFTELHGTEVSESAVRIAKEKYGLEISRGTLEQLDLPTASFDNITLFHVLEHVPDPSRLITACWRLLRPDGILVIAVPNDVLAWTSFLKKAGKWFGLSSFEAFSPKFGLPKMGASSEIHLSHFTPRVLRRLVESYGFAVLDESLDPYYAASGVKKMVYSSYYTLHKVLLSLFDSNRYDTIWMVARKQHGTFSRSIPTNGRRAA
jgi:ubiquinone/menaquinone biosynthesis C-methylase UbiE